MSIIEAILLGIVQGLTEFIPVSSSGHLVLMQDALGVSNGGLIFDVALHIGTLLALFLYFRREVKGLILGILGKNDQKRLAWLIVMATIPAALAGLLIRDWAETSFRSTVLVAVNLIVVALLMLAAEAWSKRQKTLTDVTHITRKQALIMGCAQAVALIPGVSRSGSTITAGLFSGMSRVEATRFSFLLAIPITFGAALSVMLESSQFSEGSELGVLIAGIAAAFASGLFAIRFLLRFLVKHSLAVFAYYRIGLGIIVLFSVFVS